MSKPSAAAAKKRIAAKQPVDVISSVELLALETNRAMLAVLRKQVNDAEKKVGGQEQDFITRLEAGAVVSGDVLAVVQTVTGQCRPKWKETLLEHMQKYHGSSPETCEAQIRALTIPSISKTLVIERKA